MFQNNVFKASVDTREWLRSAAVRATKTMAQTALSLITVGAAMADIDWVTVASVSAVAGICSLLTSTAGIPETPAEEVKGE